MGNQVGALQLNGLVRTPRVGQAEPGMIPFRGCRWVSLSVAGSSPGFMANLPNRTGIRTARSMRKPRRTRNNTKHRRITPPPSGVDLAQVAASSRYVGSPYQRTTCARNTWRTATTLSRVGTGRAVWRLRYGDGDSFLPNRVGNTWIDPCSGIGLRRGMDRRRAVSRSGGWTNGVTAATREDTNWWHIVDESEGRMHLRWTIVETANSPNWNSSFGRLLKRCSKGSAALAVMTALYGRLRMRGMR